MAMTKESRSRSLSASIFSCFANILLLFGGFILILHLIHAVNVRSRTHVLMSMRTYSLLRAYSLSRNNQFNEPSFFPFFRWIHHALCFLLEFSSIEVSPQTKKTKKLFALFNSDLFQYFIWIEYNQRIAQTKMISSFLSGEWIYFLLVNLFTQYNVDDAITNCSHFNFEI